MVEARLAEAMAVSNVLKASGPFSLNSMEKCGEFARERRSFTKFGNVI